MSQLFPIKRTDPWSTTDCKAAHMWCGMLHSIEYRLQHNIQINFLHSLQPSSVRSQHYCHPEALVGSDVKLEER